MRLLIQRVKSASVSVDEKIVSSIEQGMLVLVGIEAEDNQEDIIWLSNKICGLRIFDDETGVMNLSVKDIDGEILTVSQFTLHARVRKGFRPSYIDAAPPDISIPLYEGFIKQLEKDTTKKIGSGIFGAEMDVALINDGPVTLFIDSKNRK